MNDSHFDRIDRRLSDIEKNIAEISDGVKRNTRLYLSMRKPMMKLVKYMGYEKSEDEFTETELINIVIENNDERRMMNLV